MNFLPPLRAPSSVASTSRESKKEVFLLYLLLSCTLPDSAFAACRAFSPSSSALMKSKSPSGGAADPPSTLLVPRPATCAPMPGWLRG